MGTERVRPIIYCLCRICVRLLWTRRLLWSAHVVFIIPKNVFHFAFAEFIVIIGETLMRLPYRKPHCHSERASPEKGKLLRGRRNKIHTFFTHSPHSSLRTYRVNVPSAISHRKMCVSLSLHTFAPFPRGWWEQYGSFIRNNSLPNIHKFFSGFPQRKQSLCEKVVQWFGAREMEWLLFYDILMSIQIFASASKLGEHLPASKD